MLDVGISVDGADVSALLREAARLREECGVSAKEAVRRGAILLIKSLRARTPRAAKIRKVRPVPGAKPAVKDGRKLRRFYVERRPWDPSGARRAYITAGSVAEAKASPAAQIRRWGLAKKSWGWFMHELFRQSAGADPNPEAQIRPGDMVWAEVRDDAAAGARYTVLENRLAYISDIVPSGAVSEAAGAAGRRMEKIVDQRIARAAARMSA